MLLFALIVSTLCNDKVPQNKSVKYVSYSFVGILGALIIVYLVYACYSNAHASDASLDGSHLEASLTSDTQFQNSPSNPNYQQNYYNQPPQPYVNQPPQPYVNQPPQPYGNQPYGNQPYGSQPY